MVFLSASRLAGLPPHFFLISSKRNRVEPERKSDQGAFAGPLEPRRAGGRWRRVPLHPPTAKTRDGGWKRKDEDAGTALCASRVVFVPRPIFYLVAMGSLRYKVSRRSFPATAGQRRERATRAFYSKRLFLFGIPKYHFSFWTPPKREIVF